MSSPLQENDIFSLDRIDLVAQTIRDTALGSPLIEFGFMSDVHVSLEAGMKTAAFYSEDFFSGVKKISLNAELDDATLTVALAHELRHVEQTILREQSLCDKLNTMDEVKLKRIFEGDASAFSIGVAYEIYQETGNETFLEAFDEYGEGDIRDAFLMSASPKKPVVSHIFPFYDAFNQWFDKPERLKHYDNEVFEQCLVFFNESAAPLSIDLMNEVGTISAGYNYILGTDIKDSLLVSEKYVGGIASSVISHAP